MGAREHIKDHHEISGDGEDGDFDVVARVLHLRAVDRVRQPDPAEPNGSLQGEAQKIWGSTASGGLNVFSSSCSEPSVCVWRPPHGAGTAVRLALRSRISEGCERRGRAHGN